MTTEIALPQPTRGALTLASDQVEWTPVQLAALDHIGIADAPAADQQVFLHVCQRTGLDPFARQIYMIPRKEGYGQNAKVKWTIQTGIDGFRAKANERPEYRGQVGPQWCGEDGVWRDVWIPEKPPVAARVGILRDDMAEPLWGVAMYREYVQTVTYEGRTKPTKMWEQKAAHMIAKCAEALGLRRAFPDQLSGLYTDDEMAHLDNPAPRRVRTVIEHDAAPVTAAELTGAPLPATRDWDIEIAAAVQASDLETLRQLHRDAKGHEDVRSRIVAASEQVRAAADEGDEDDVVDAEVVAPEPTAGDADTVSEFFAEANAAAGES